MNLRMSNVVCLLLQRQQQSSSHDHVISMIWECFILHGFPFTTLDTDTHTHTHTHILIFPRRSFAFPSQRFHYPCRTATSALRAIRERSLPPSLDPSHTHWSVCLRRSPAGADSTRRCGAAAAVSGRAGRRANVLCVCGEFGKHGRRRAAAGLQSLQHPQTESSTGTIAQPG